MTKKEQIAFVTGANKGIGLEIVRQLAQKGYRVFLGARDPERGRTALKKIRSENEITFVEIDVSKKESIERAAAELSRLTDHLDVLINNAGICLDEDKDILTISAETFERTLRTNTLGPLWVAQAFLPLLEKSRAPRIVNVSSSGGQLADGADGWAPGYCISKTALNGVTSQLAAALPKFGVNSVCPGWVRTDMAEPARADRSKKARVESSG